GKQVTVHMDELAPGAVREVKLETPVKLEAPAAGSTNIPASLRLNALAPGMDAPPAVSVEQPVALTQTSDLQLTSRVREGQLVFNVYNRSNKSYGAEGELGRDVKIQLNPTGANAPLVEVAGEFQPLTKQLELPIAKLAPGETQQIRLNVKAPTGWKPGQEFSIETRLSIKDSKVAPVRGRSSAIAYKIDVNDGLNKQFSVQNLGVTCQYDHALWFNYEVKDIQITKPENADYVDVKVKLKGDKESPVYKIAVSEIPKGFLENVLKERNFTSYELRDFLQGLGLPLKKPASWNISSCYAEKDFSSNSDPARFAALEAGKLGHSSEQLNETSASVMQGHSAQKSLSSSNYTQTAELRNSEDSVNAR
ncbi:MAG: COG1470 family protein, partial [Bdellovibrionota bacterium]